MKGCLLLVVSMLCVSQVCAENLFQTNNPFPQTVPQTMNNIYESNPIVMKREEQKKAKKSWFHRNKNIEQETNSIENYKIPVYPVVNEGVPSDSSYYMFTTGQ